MKNDNGICIDEAIELIHYDDSKVMIDLLPRANKVREDNCGNGISICAITNAKSGNCSEDCAFCPQSVFSESNIETYPLKDCDTLIKEAESTSNQKVHNLGIVTSGKKIEAHKEKKSILSSISSIKSKARINVCASLGIAPVEFMEELKGQGLSSYHHNLETAESYYHKICTTRTYQENVDTLINAKKSGLKVCSGGLFGLGESNEQRVELFDALRKINVDSVPINFLNPIEGTPIKGRTKALRPIECLKIIAIARLMMPETQIRLCGGREKNLREMQSWVFFAGGNALMVGHYLTTEGRKICDDLQMIKDAGMELLTNGGCGV